MTPKLSTMRISINTNEKYQQFYLDGKPVGPSFKRGEGYTDEMIHLLKDIMKVLDARVEFDVIQ